MGAQFTPAVRDEIMYSEVLAKAQKYDLIAAAHKKLGACPAPHALAQEAIVPEAASCGVVKLDAGGLSPHLPSATDGRDCGWVRCGLHVCLLAGS